MNQAEVEAYLLSTGCRFVTSDKVSHLRLTVQPTGEIVNFYRTGAISVQGSPTPLRKILEGWKKSGVTPPSEAMPQAKMPKPNEVEAREVTHSAQTASKDIFIVYGHDKTNTQALENLLFRMGLNPIVLDKLPAAGHTIIEKLESFMQGHQTIGYACVLLTPDDSGYSNSNPIGVKPRARQNVILELGMVLVSLGRGRVSILYQEDVEKPSDIDGLLYIPFKTNVDEVKARLYKELSAAGYQLEPAAL